MTKKMTEHKFGGRCDFCKKHALLRRIIIAMANGGFATQVLMSACDSCISEKNLEKWKGD